MGEVSRRLNSGEVEMAQLPVGPDQLAALIRRIADGTISNNAGKQVFEALWSATAPKIGASSPTTRVDSRMAMPHQREPSAPPTTCSLK